MTWDETQKPWSEEEARKPTWDDFEEILGAAAEDPSMLSEYETAAVVLAARTELEINDEADRWPPAERIQRHIIALQERFGRPEARQSRSYLAVILAYLDRDTEAIPELESARTDLKCSPDVYLALLTIRLKAGAWSESACLLREAQSRFPQEDWSMCEERLRAIRGGAFGLLDASGGIVLG